MSLRDLSDKTKIPERSLERLESGAWNELPAEVYMRGFVRSYARCVGLDPEEMARRYGEIVHGPGASSRPAARADMTPATVPAPLRPRPRASTVLPEAAATATSAATATAATAATTDEKATPATPATSGEGAEPAKAAAGADMLDELRSLSRAILDAGRESRRMPLTLAVIILVIVATLTMSLLLSRPSHVGDGLSRTSGRITIHS
jgi:hypothetical protein